MDENYSVLYICHYGTKGQKWGLRKYQNKDGSLTPAGRARYGKDGDSSFGKRGRGPVTKSGKPVITSHRSKGEEPESDDKPRKKPLSKMSDDDLRNEINRFKLEKEYKQLLAETNPPKEKRARKIIADVAESSVKNIGTQAVTYAMGVAVNKICREAFKIDYDIVNPKKGQKDK